MLTLREHVFDRYAADSPRWAAAHYYLWPSTNATKKDIGGKYLQLSSWPSVRRGVFAHLGWVYGFLCARYSAIASPIFPTPNP
jgi:hypothetical protein